MFDDIDGQGRVQLRSTHAGSELNLGHLAHAADNYRGSLRGAGAELRTDAYGVARAGAGLLVSSYKLNHSASSRDPLGENAAGVSFMKQAVAIADAFSSAAGTHQSVPLAAHLGATKANESVLDPAAAPLKAGLTSLSGMGSTKGLQAALADAKAKNTEANDSKVPHLSDPALVVAAQNSFGANAGQSLQLANGEMTTLMCGQDGQVVTGGQMRLQSKQTIGLLGSAIKPGEANFGMQFITAKDSIAIQSQADNLNITAKIEINVASTNAYIDLAAVKSISLATAGGASIIIDGGNVTLKCPGHLVIHAGKKKFSSQAQIRYKLPILPQSVCVECLAKRAAQRSAFINKGT